MINWKKIAKPKSKGGLWLRPMRDLNLAYVAKLGWRWLNNQSVIWAKTLTMKYANGTTTLECLYPQCIMSDAWRSMVKAKYLIQKGSRWAIGNGCITRFWIDTCLLDVPLS